MGRTHYVHPGAVVTYRVKSDGIGRPLTRREKSMIGRITRITLILGLLIAAALAVNSAAQASSVSLTVADCTTPTYCTAWNGSRGVVGNVGVSGWRSDLWVNNMDLNSNGHRDAIAYIGGWGWNSGDSTDTNNANFIRVGIMKTYGGSPVRPRCAGTSGHYEVFAEMYADGSSVHCALLDDLGTSAPNSAIEFRVNTCDSNGVYDSDWTGSGAGYLCVFEGSGGTPLVTWGGKYCQGTDVTTNSGYGNSLCTSMSNRVYPNEFLEPYSHGYAGTGSEFLCDDTTSSSSADCNIANIALNYQGGGTHTLDVRGGQGTGADGAYNTIISANILKKWVSTPYSSGFGFNSITCWSNTFSQPYAEPDPRDIWQVIYYNSRC